MASAVISNRLKIVLHNLIHEDQKGFIAGRFIGENIRLIYDVLFETKNQNIPGLLLSIDFEKAFDTVSWKFISKTLDYFNFGDSVKKWIKLFQNGAESSILQNGFISEFFYLKRGCRQGDPISPYIFLLCAEILGQMVRKNENIKGIKINNKEYKISQYADDTQLLLDGSEKSLRNTLEMLYTFYNMSGLKINIEKTKAIWIGVLSNSERKMCGDFQLDWTQGPFKILGVNFATEVYNIWDLNTNDILTKVKCVLKQWTKRKITLIGKITIIKSLTLSKFVHLFISLPDPPKEVFKQLERMFYNFIWNNGPDRIKRKILIKNLAAGGLRMVQLCSFTKALKITWLRRILQQTDNTTWSTLSNINFAHLFIYGGTYASQQTLNVINPFWRDFLKAWSHFCNVCDIDSIQHILDSPIWFNTNLIQENLFINDWCKKGVTNIADLLDEQGNFYQFETFKRIYNVRGTALDYQHLLKQIPVGWKSVIKNNKVFTIENKFNTRCSIYSSYLMQNKKGSRIFYDIIEKVNQLNVNDKWVAEVGDISDNDLRVFNASISKFREVKLQDFQFKINNKILITNYFLWKIGKINNNLCSYCKEHPEKINHLFLTCAKVQEFWNSLKTWLYENANINVNIEKRNIIFSYQGRNSLINYILV